MTRRFYTLSLLLLLSFMNTTNCSKDSSENFDQKELMEEIETRSSSYLEELAHEISTDSIFLQYVDLQNTLTKRVQQTRASLDSLSLVALDAEIDSWQYDSLPEVLDVVFMQICGCTQAEFDTLSTRLERISIALSDKYGSIFSDFTENDIALFIPLWVENSKDLFFTPSPDDNEYTPNELEFRQGNCCGFVPICPAQQNCVDEACNSYDSNWHAAFGNFLNIVGTSIAGGVATGGSYGLWTGNPWGVASGSALGGAFGFAAGLVGGGIYFGHRVNTLQEVREGACKRCRDQVECED